MAFGSKFNNNDIDKQRIQAQLAAEEEGDEDSHEINDSESSLSENGSSKTTVTPEVKSSPAPTRGRRPSFNLANVEKANVSSDTLGTDEDEDDHEEIPRTSSRRNMFSGVKVEVANDKPVNKRVTFNTEAMKAKPQSTDSYFDDGLGTKEEESNPDVIALNHVNQANVARAEQFERKRTNRPNFNNQFVSVQEISHENYYREGRTQSGLENGLDIRLNTLIDRVCEFFNKKDDEISKIKKEALKKPEKIRAEYQKIYDTQVEPESNKRYESIQAAKKEFPNKFIFMIVNEDKHKLHGFDKTEHPEYAIYDGVTISIVNYDKTPFGPPSILFSEDEEDKDIEAEEV